MEQDRLQFKAAVQALNNMMRENPDHEKEFVENETAAKAIIIIKNMRINKIGDAFLYAAALNVMNTFVKQSKENKKDIGYFFKRNTDVVANYLLNNPDEDVKLEIQMDQGMTLLVAMMFDMQFSFHQVVITESNEKFKAKDFENPELRWDGVRKQSFANTVFNFALEQSFERTDIMLDGTPLNEGMEKLLNDLREEKLTLADLKRPFYSDRKDEADRPHQQKRNNHANIGLINANSTDYRFRNQPIAVLYESTMTDFLKAFNERNLVTYLISQFEEGYGEQVSGIEKYVLKYGLSVVKDVLDCTSVSEDAGVRIDYHRNKMQDNYNIVFSSYDENGIIRTSGVQLIEWTEAKPGEDRDSVYYRDYKNTSEMSLGIHPSLVASEYIAKVTHDIKDDETFTMNMCSFFYDACDDDDVVLSKPGDVGHRSKVYFINNVKEMVEHLSPALSGNNGLKALAYMKKLSSYNREKHGLTEDQDYAMTTTMNLLDTEEKFLLIIDGRAGAGKKTMAEVLSGIMEKRKETMMRRFSEEDPDGETDLMFYIDYIPEEIDYDLHKGNVIMYDPFVRTPEEFDSLIRLRSEAAYNSVQLRKLSMHICPGFVDDGSGNNWLIRHLQLGVIEKQIWNPGNYKINLLNSPDEFFEEEGMVNVVMPESINYIKETRTIEMSPEDKMYLYTEFAKGRNGVNIYTSNPELKEYIQQEINSEVNRYKWLKDFRGDYSGDYDKLVEAQKELLNNSVVRNKYEAYLISYLGRENWDKLLEQSKDWMISSMLTYNDIKRFDQTMDFSGVVIQISKMFEKESARRFAKGYVEFLQNKYGEEYLDHTPDALLKWKGGTKKLADLNEVNLGTVSYIAGISRGRVVNEEDYNEFMPYWYEYLVVDKENAHEQLMDALNIIDYVRSHYRNMSAHSNSISPTLALECIRYVVTEKQMFRKLFDKYLW